MRNRAQLEQDDESIADAAVLGSGQSRDHQCGHYICGTTRTILAESLREAERHLNSFIQRTPFLQDA